MKWLVLASVMIATPAAAADRFDLVCTAKKTQMRYRIDLARGEWCAGDCTLVEKIVEITTGQLVLERVARTRPGDIESVTAINRITGAWHRFSFDPSLDVVPFNRNGDCTPAPFSGFPEAQRRF